MADEAGPSGAGLGSATPEALAEADAKFEKGIQCIRTNDLEAAVQLFSEVLEVRTKHYGELALECAPAYYRYGSALLYQAQDSGDVFGAGVKDGDEEDEEGGEEEPEPQAQQDKENGGKGKAPAAAPAPEEGEDEEEGGEEGEESSGGGDLQLAWENLESAKVIWQRDGADKNAQQLADVHGLLGDVAMESDDFGTALAELDAALGYLQKITGEDDRRIAEVQYKRCCALQFGGNVEDALPAVQAACECLIKRREVLLKKLAAPGEGEDAGKLQEESEECGALLGDLREKVQELEELIAQNADTKSMVKGVLSQFAAAVGGGAPAAAAAEPAAAPAAAAGGAPAGEETTEGFGSAAGAAAGGEVKNLGVVGRGTKRINLQPVQTNVPAAAAGSGAAAGGEPAAKKKRSLEDLMGGGGEGETTIGFGGSAALAAADAKPAAAEGKAAEPAAPAGVPAFLQAENIAKVYGATPEQQK